MRLNESHFIMFLNIVNNNTIISKTILNLLPTL